MIARGIMKYCYRCGKDIANAVLFCSQCGCRIRQTTTHLTEKDIIKNYFNLGLNYDTIVQFLSKYHGIEMCKRTLKRRLQKYDLKKHNNVSAVLLHAIIRQEIQGPASLFGYRRMQQHLSKNFNMNVQRDRVMDVLKTIDPVGTEQRRSRKLRRRMYTSPGPDHCWHSDGYDKLKPYGLPIHGAIDGFSRKVIWLKVTKTNNDPSVVAKFFIDAMRREKRAPSLLRTDCGSENGVMAAIQCFLHQNEKAHLFSRSISNQRIENWWSHMRRGYSGWIINFFKRLVDEGILSPLNHLCMECVWFVFSQFLQSQLDNIMQQWNTHFIRKSQNHTIGGVPHEMYYLPEKFGYEHQGLVLVAEQIDQILQQKDIYEEANDAVNVDQNLKAYFRYVVHREKLPYPPNTWEEAERVFRSIIEKAML